MVGTIWNVFFVTAVGKPWLVIGDLRFFVVADGIRGFRLSLARQQGGAPPWTPLALDVDLVTALLLCRHCCRPWIAVHALSIILDLVVIHR